MELHGDAGAPGREQPVQRPGRGRELGALKVLSAVSEGGGTGRGWGADISGLDGHAEASGLDLKSNRKP